MMTKLRVREASLKKGANVYLKEGSRLVQYQVERIDHPQKKVMRHPGMPWKKIPGTSKEIQVIGLKKPYSSIRKDVIIGEDSLWRKKSFAISRGKNLKQK